VVNCTEQPKIGSPFNVTLDIGSKIQIPISAYIKVNIYLVQSKKVMTVTYANDFFRRKRAIALNGVKK
jgi:hypothetical protein